MKHAATVCIPTFNDTELLDRAIESVIDQAAEVIVVDDGSSQDVETDVARFPVRYVKVTQRGLPNARNTGLMLARFPAFVPLDADDFLNHDFLEQATPALVGADVVCVTMREHGARSGLHLPARDVTVDEQWQENRFPYCAVYRTTMLRELGGWNGRMVARGKRFAYAAAAIFNYSVRSSSFTTTVVDAHRDENFAEMRRHHDR